MTESKEISMAVHPRHSLVRSEEGLLQRTKTIAAPQEVTVLSQLSIPGVLQSAETPALGRLNPYVDTSRFSLKRALYLPTEDLGASGE